MANKPKQPTSNRVPVERLEGLETKHGIELKVNAFVEYEEYNECFSVSVVLEIFGEAIAHDIKFIVNIYNEKGEIIGTEMSNGITKDTFEGIDSTQITIRAPKGEKIAKVLIYPQKR